MKKTLVSLVFLTIGFTLAFGQSMKLIETLKIAPEAKVLDPPKSFCVTEKDIVLIPDTQTGTIKILKKEGNFLKIVNPFGPGNELFTRPVCFYSKDEGLLGILDDAMRMGFIFRKSGQADFELVKTFDCRKYGYDIKFAGGGIQTIVSGYITDNKDRPFDLYSINNENGQIDYLLSSPDKHGLPTYETYVEEYYKKQTLPAIGIKGFFDIQGNDLFYVWEGALRIIKLDLKSKVLTKVFGHETPQYNRPDGSMLSESYINGDFNNTWKLQETFSYVRNIFTTSNNVFVVYETGKKNKDDTSTFRMQIYTNEGNFIKDILIPGNPGKQMSFDKLTNELYVLTKDTGTGKDELAILKYKISR